MKSCPVFNLMHLFGGKWTFVVLEEISLHPDHGFNVLIKRLKKVSPKILSQRLRDLEKGGLIEKNTVSQKPPTTSYRITLRGKEAYDIFYRLKQMHDRYQPFDQSCSSRTCTACSLY